MTAVAEISASQSWEGVLVSGIEDGLAASSATASTAATATTATAIATSLGSTLTVLVVIVLAGETKELGALTSGHGVGILGGDLGGDHLGANLLDLVGLETLLVDLLVLSSLGSWEVSGLSLGLVVIKSESDFFFGLFLFLGGITLFATFSLSVAVVSGSVDITVSASLTLGLFSGSVVAIRLLFLVATPSVASSLSAVVSLSTASTRLSVHWVSIFTSLALVALSVSTGFSSVDSWVAIFINTLVSDSISSTAWGASSLGAAVASSASLSAATATSTALTSVFAVVSSLAIFVVSAATVLAWVAAISVGLVVSNISELALTIINLWLVLLGLNGDLLLLLWLGLWSSCLGLLDWSRGSLWSWSECSKSVATESFF